MSLTYKNFISYNFIAFVVFNYLLLNNWLLNLQSQELIVTKSLIIESPTLDYFVICKFIIINSFNRKKN